MESTRPGDLLAGRYRLADLLSETPAGRFWLAHDQMLDRPVALHVIPGEDPRAGAVLDAARAAATVSDPHLLRVLDAEAGPELAFVVNEWGVGTSVDHLLAEHGPVSPRRAAWITAEVADCLARGHAAGHPHGRLIPEDVLLGEDGGVHVIGYAVEAALYGVAAPSVGTDLADLGGLLHALLSGRWAGPSASAVPPVPVAHGRPLRPRQVRAGVPRVLDDLCSALLGGDPETPVPPAAEVAAQLRVYVGDPTDLEPIEASSSGSGRPAEAPAADATSVALPRVPTECTPAQEPDPEPDPPEEDDGGPATVPGLPVFADAPPVPPPPPVKPLFADEARRPRYDAPPPSVEDSWIFSSVPQVADLGDGLDHEPVPGRRWLGLALVVAIVVGLIVVALVVYHWHSDRSDTDVIAPTPQASSAAAPTPRAIASPGVVSFDPEGSDDAHTEYPELVHNAVDGNPRTAWHTSTYKQQLGPKGLKNGLGLVLDLHRVYDVDSVAITLTGTTGLSVFVTDIKPGSAPTGRAAATTTGQGAVTLRPAATGRYVVVWLTKLPRGNGGFIGTVDEVSVTGTPVT